MILQPLSGGNTSQNKKSTSSNVLQPLSSIKSSEKVTTPQKFASSYSYSPTAYKAALDKPLVAKAPEPEAPKTPKTVWENIQSASSEVTAKILLLNKEDKNNGLVAKVGRKLQQIPNADLGSKGQNLFKSTDTETKIVNFISNLPSSFLQSWGQHLEQVDTPEGREKLKVGTMELPQTMGEVKTHIWNKDWQKALETAMSNPAFMLAIDTSDFIPIGGLVKRGVQTGLKSAFKQGAKEVAEQVVQEIPAESRKLAQTIVKEALEESEKKVVKEVASVEVKPTIKATKPKPVVEDPLTQEARKYKSAEEFVNSQVNSYHGTNKSFDKFELTEGKRTGGMGAERTVKNNAIFLSNDRNVADFFGKNRSEVQGGYNRIIETKIPQEQILDLSKLPSDVKRKAIDLVERWTGDKHTSIPADLRTWLVDQSEFVDLVKSKGFKGVRFNEGSVLKGDRYTLKTQGGNYTTAIFDPKDILTKSQLTDIWNKANKPTVQPKIEPKVSGVSKKQLPAKQGQSRVFERLQKENPEQLTGELPYDKAVLKTEFDRAATNIAKNKQKAYEVAMGRSSTSDIESVATNIEMAEKALSEGNNALYEKLVRKRSLDQTRRGQAIVAEKASIEDNSTARYVKELLSTRLENLGKQYLSGLKEGNTIKKHATEIIDKKVGALEITIKRGKLDTKTALKLLDELTCV